MDETYVEELSDNEEHFVIEKAAPRRIKSQATTPNIQSLYQDWKDGDLIIDPIFQRNYVWNKTKASNLIESILLNIPLPIIFTARNQDKEEVIDGQQRLTSIFSYIDGIFPDKSKFKLSANLKILADKIGGKTFEELDESFQRSIKKYPLFVVSISEESQEEVKFEMFERLNTNITQLNAQELRNCLYRGGFNELLKVLANNSDFQYILNKPSFKRRMQDVELVLMFSAFYHTHPNYMRKNLKQFLNDEMRNYTDLTTDEMRDIESKFKKSISIIKNIWNDRAFNVCKIDKKTKNIQWSRTFNQGLFQILTHGFIPYQKHEILPYSDLIYEEFINLQIHDQIFRDTLTGSGTNSPINVKLKFKIWELALKGILEYDLNSSRSFSTSYKDELWYKQKECKICSELIKYPEDAVIEGITCYWKDNLKIPNNPRLSHRYCHENLMTMN